MITDRWERTKQILEDALRLPKDQRPSFVASACFGDAALRAEVESLIDSHEQAGTGFLAADAFQLFELGSSAASAQIQPGQVIGQYRVLSEIGRGGMGVVYQAEDIKLGRRVAVKFLPAEVAGDPASFERFEQEARAASALDHPNICGVYQLGEHEGKPFIAMQLLEGQTLREWIETPTATTSRLQPCVALAIQIAKGLQAAHEKGIIHRDIKPANIFVTARGEAKILDFGLAKLLSAQAPTGPSGEAPGATSTGPNPTFSSVQLTRTGTAMGTAAYMSPEQIRGEQIDSRTDIFAVGAVFYEMVTGRRAFAGDRADKVRDAILHTEPLPIRKVNRHLPAGLERIVNRALNKDRERRYQSATDLIVDLEKLERQTESRKLSSVWIASAAIVVVAAWVAGDFYHNSRQKPLSEKDTVVLADFADSTGDKTFDSTLKQTLSVTLNQSPFLNVIADEKVAWTLQKMQRPASTALVQEVAREVCQRANVRSYIAGSISSLGNQYIVGLKAMNCRSGDVLVQEQITAASKENVLRALNGAAAKLADKLGQALAAMPKLDLPLEDVSTSSLFALEAYSTGVRTDREKGWAEGLRYFQRAVELDADFVSAYSAIGNSYNNLGETTTAAEYFSKAFELREHATRRENLGATADYYTNVTGQLDQAAQAYRDLMANYPRLWGPHVGLGNVYTSQGLYAKADEEYREVVRLGGETTYENLANTALALQQFDEASKAIQEAQTKKLGGYLLHLQLYALAFLKSDPKGMSEQQEWFASHSDVANDGLAIASDTEAYAGHVSNSRELTRQSVESAIQADSKEAGAIWKENAALREAAFGNASEAKGLAVEGLKLSPTSQGVQMEAALGLAMIGDTEQPSALMKQLQQHYPLDTAVQALWLPPIRAQLALDRKNPAAALSAVPAIGALEFGQITFLNNISCLYPAYIRGNAYLAAGQGAPAAAEFQKILDHNGIVWNCWTGALAHLGLARANALQAKTAHGADADAARSRALAAYKEFLTLWKDADPDIPILKQATSENAKLLEGQ